MQNQIPVNAAGWAKTKLGCAYNQSKRTSENIFDCSSLVGRLYSTYAAGHGNRERGQVQPG